MSIKSISGYLSSKKAALFGENRFIGPDGGDNGVYLFPMRLTIIYLLFSVFVYIFGALNWTTYTPFLFYSLIFGYMAALWAGYRVGLMKKTPSHPFEWTETHTDFLAKTVSVLLIINYIVYVINIFRDYGLATLDFAELGKQMWVGIKNPGLGYFNRYLRVQTLQGTDIIGGTAFSLFNYVWAFVNYPILIFGMLYFKKLRLHGKIFAVLHLVTNVVFYLSIGTNIDIFKIYLLAELPVIMRAFGRWREKALSKKEIIRIVALLLAGLVLVGCYFTWMMVSRGGINNYDQPEYNVGGVQLDESIIPDAPSGSDTVSSTIVPPIIMKFWISFCSYFTQGYYGMSQALTESWTPMFGVGSSMFLVDFISEHVADIDRFTYQSKIEATYGWNSDIQWNCMYTWLANDVSFFGVIIVMFLIGILFARLFKDAISTANPFAKASVFYLIMMMVFIPCNNQIAQRADTLFSFTAIVVCWLISNHPPVFLKKLLAKTTAK